jgi:hypothetical protein
MAFDSTFRALRAGGLLIAWVCAVACGWNVGRQSDLLDAVLHGAIAWAGVVGIWLGALAIIRRSLILSSAATVSPPESHDPGAASPGP